MSYGMEYALANLSYPSYSVPSQLLHWEIGMALALYNTAQLQV